MVNAAKIPFPSVAFGEFTIFRPFTAPGLFDYRFMQSLDFLTLPDLGEGSMTAEERQSALEQMVGAHRPMAAVAIFLGVVALEDFVRELGARLAAVSALYTHFPSISDLQPRLKANPKLYARPDIDACNISTWVEVNDLYARALGAAPIAASEMPKLQDLALIRHTVAHHAALVRPIDAPRFQHWDVPANAVINPPVDFVREILQYLHEIGRQFEAVVRRCIFVAVLKKECPDWRQHPSTLLSELFETFNWFGFLPLQRTAFIDPFAADADEHRLEQYAAVHAELTGRCLEEIGSKYAI